MGLGNHNRIVAEDWMATHSKSFVAQAEASWSSNEDSTTPGTQSKTEMSIVDAVDEGPLTFFCPLLPGHVWPAHGPKLVKLKIDVRVLIEGWCIHPFEKKQELIVNRNGWKVYLPRKEPGTKS